MIEKKENTEHRWLITDCEGVLFADIRVDRGELYTKIINGTPYIEDAKEFHQALGEAIQIAEEQNNG